jgi:hypothetical protein
MTGAHLSFLVVHIAMGLTGLASGAASMTFRKGSARHRRAGNVFFVSMLIMSATGALIAAVFRPSMGNVMGGLLTFYLVSTAWLTVWRPPRETGRLDVAAALLGLATAGAGAAWGIAALDSPTHRFSGYPPALYFIFGGVALLATLFDFRIIARGGLGGVQRTTRHLWRMCAGMFMATTSFFIGQARHFPAPVRESGVLKVPVFLVIGVLLYSMARVRVLPWLRARRAPSLRTSA